MSAEDDLRFLRNLQRLLDESLFSATYKFALLQALADLSVEHAPDENGRLTLPLTDIAARFIEYYWRQAVPFRNGQVLRQNTSSQAAVIRRVQEARTRYDGMLGNARADARGWNSLCNDVARVVSDMPLQRLQTVGQITHEFLYRQDKNPPGKVVLLPGVARAFRNFHGLVTNLVRGAWVNHIQRITANRQILGQRDDLSGFLFGVGRQALTRYRRVLREHQEGLCFYCRHAVADNGELDHFIPWARYPLHVGENFVLAHRRCNNAKRDFLPAIEHLERWHTSHLHEASRLDTRLGDYGLISDPARTRTVALWAYEQGNASGAQLWLKNREFEPCDYRWKAYLT